jgi:hypothetical protein
MLRKDCKKIYKILHNTFFSIWISGRRMEINPWQVDSLEAFTCLKCPECTYFSKEESTFKNHATENHPLS